MKTETSRRVDGKSYGCVSGILCTKSNLLPCMGMYDVYCFRAEGDITSFRSAEYKNIVREVRSMICESTSPLSDAGKRKPLFTGTKGLNDIWLGSSLYLTRPVPDGTRLAKAAVSSSGDVRRTCYLHKG